MRKLLKKHAFTLWLLVAVGLAILFPDPASPGGFLHPEITTKLGIFAIFFLQGLGLPTSELTAGYRPRRLHAFVLTWNYLWFPALTILSLLPLASTLPAQLRLGFLFLAILPTTVSSAVVFSTVSGGNTANAIFATVFSNLLAVPLVPAVAVAYLATETEATIQLLPLLTKLFLLIIAPLILGQTVRKTVPDNAARLAKKTKSAGGWIILFIVHSAFANSVSSGFLDELGAQTVAAVIAATVLLLLLVSSLVWMTSALLKPTAPERIAAFYCASQKSLATGLPLGSTILAAAPESIDAAAVLIPLLCYHPAQLVLAGFLSTRFTAKKPGG